MGRLWRSHRIAKQNKSYSRSLLYYLHCQGSSRSPQWPSVSKRRKKSSHKQSAGVKGKSLHRENKLNIIYERYKFNNRLQEQTETLDTYITTLRALAETCEFETFKDDLISDRIVCGVRDKGIRRKLLQECGLTLSKCIDICRANEATAAQLKDMAPSQTTKQEANAVSQKESSKKPKNTKENGRDPKDQLSAKCKYCSYKHERKRDKCSAYGKTCS